MGESGTAISAHDTRGIRLADDVVLVTYVAREGGRTSLCSSIWVRGDEGWRLYFHQGRESADSEKATVGTRWISRVRRFVVWPTPAPLARDAAEAVAAVGLQVVVP